MNTIVGDETFFAGKIKECAVSYTRLFGQLTRICGPRILWENEVLIILKIFLEVYQMCIEMDYGYRTIYFVKRSKNRKNLKK